ncbi:ABC transporter substrate-binding protein [Streptomyces sp. NPDC051561]|uniref:ABC transporter substrate-binding protein n=1 Tax=Streptomyces sp. NPDC051561 TaxID=3365658 RepID=UPI003799C248
MKRTLITVAAVAAAALSLSACGTTEPAADKAAAKKPAEKITLTDAHGAKVVLDGPAKKVVGTEWNVVENLVALGVQPAGVADIKGYTAWDTAAPLKGGAKDIGTRGEPSMDTIAALAPDLVIATTDLPPAALKQLRKVAPVLELKAADAADPIGRMTDDINTIAQATGTTAQADKLLKDFDKKLADGKKAIADAGHGGAQFAFADGYVVSGQAAIRPYTKGSLIGAVNEKLGLKTPWTVPGDKDYGLGKTDVEGLTKLGDVQFAYIGNKTDKDSNPFTGMLAKDAVWKSLPFVKKGNVHQLPDGVWMFGGPLSMNSYVDSVVTALKK